jgi:metal-responsive CopG/Arc/MetJ family transcriptional regulator
MATVNFSVPDDVKEAFNEAFRGRNKSAVIAELMREAVERAHRQQRSHEAIARLLERRPRAPLRSEDELRVSREEGRP